MILNAKILQKMHMCKKITTFAQNFGLFTPKNDKNHDIHFFRPQTIGGSRYLGRISLSYKTDHTPKKSVEMALFFIIIVLKYHKSALFCKNIA